MIKGIYCNTIYETKYWLSFSDVCSICTRKDSQSVITEISVFEPYSEDVEQEAWEIVLDELFSPVWFPTESQTNEISLELIQNIYRRFYHHCVFAVDELCNSCHEYFLKYESEIDDFKTKLTNIFVQTKDRYFTLLKLYKSEESKLLDGVKTITTGVGRFNDTPQNITDGDEFGDNTHLSNITKSTAEAVSDVDTKMARLDEIQKRYRNLLKDWTDEFAGLFIESENI